MKNMSLAITAALCAALCVSVHADLSGTFKTITLDGSLADWSNPGDVLYDSAEITVGGAYDALSLANDAANLYIGMDTSAAGGGSVNNAWTHSIYFDTDMNANTGFDSGWMTFGYDRLVQYGASGTTYSVYEFSGATQANWGWTFLNTISYSFADDIAELSVPLSNLGVTGNDMKVTFNANPGVDTWAASWEGASETYTVAIPEPTTLSMVVALGGAILFIRRKITI